MWFLFCELCKTVFAYLHKNLLTLAEKKERDAFSVFGLWNVKKKRTKNETEGTIYSHFLRKTQFHLTKNLLIMLLLYSWCILLLVNVTFCDFVLSLRFLSENLISFLSPGVFRDLNQLEWL